MYIYVYMTNYLSTTAMTKVREAMVLDVEARKVGEEYFKLAKYVFRPTNPLWLT